MAQKELKKSRPRTDPPFRITVRRDICHPDAGFSDRRRNEWHFVGVALAAILLGPSAAVLIITVVLIVQALVFGDGGVTALGLNILNMAIVGGAVAFAVYSVGNRNGPNESKALCEQFVAAWTAVVAGALACAFELGASAALSPAYAVRPTLPCLRWGLRMRSLASAKAW
jgi:hypothetical protein